MDDEEALGVVLKCFLLSWLRLMAILITTGIILELAYWESVH